jgi:hypothetical protein
MKIKRFDNLWLMGVIISGAILGIIYLLKIFFPSFVIEVAHIESIVNIGHYIDQHKWAWYLASFSLSFFVCYFTFCACCRKKTLTVKETIITIACILILYAIKEFLPSQYTSLNISIMVFMPMLFKGDFKATSISFIVMNFMQTLTLEIRGLALMISDFNFATLIVLCIDSYIIVWLLYCYFNFNKENT